MAVKSYIVQPVSGREEEMIMSFRKVPQCELLTTERPDVYVLLTDTANRQQEDELLTVLETIPGLACLSLVSAYDEIDGVNT